jgi:stage II sporulation protein D
MTASAKVYGPRFLLLFCLFLACVRPQPETRPPSPPPPHPPPPAAEVEPPLPAPAPRIVPGPAEPLSIRVGLASDLERLELPCCDAGVELVAGDVTYPLSVATAVAPADVLARAPIYRLQVAALKDERQAEGIADYLRKETGEPADAVFDAGTDLYKVRYGRFASRQEAEPHRERLAGLGLSQAWVASEGGALENPGFTIAGGGRAHFAAGRWLELTAPEGAGIAVHGGRYRGRVLLYLNGRGRLNLINELELDDYLRGVVPREMGPELYDQLEALKAQTVAARTYAVRSLGEFSSEGYDICSTPRCQVYGGMAVEHPFSDRAVAETAGEVVLFEGQPAETFYGATCGGHTENVEVVFPLKRGAYLRGVPCMEAGPQRLGGDAAGESFPRPLTERLLPPSPGPPERTLEARLEHLALLAGLPVPQDRLASLERREVTRFLASVLDLALDPRVLAAGLEPPADPPPDWRERDVRLASYLAESGVLAEPRDQPLGEDEIETLLFRLALYVGALRHDDAHFLELDEAGLTVRTAAGHRTFRLPDHFTTFRRVDAALVAAPLELAAGDRLDLYWHRRELVALVQPIAARAVALGRHAPRQRWTRHVTDGELRRAVQTRYPGFPFSGFEVLARGVSGRVGKLKLLGSDGRTQEVEGLAVRWTLDVPDTLFEARRDGNGGWLFEGRGWGHGVGMCQAGAFGMARRHLGYREILQHYYSGVELGLVRKLSSGFEHALGP